MENSNGTRREKIIIYSLLFLIIIAGFFIRFLNIDQAPPGVYPDEAVNGIDALTANETGNYQWFYPANNGREGLFMNLIALCFKAFGISVLSLKLPSIIFGTLTILGTFLLAKELFSLYLSEKRSRRIGLISAFLVSVSFWAINFSRISFRANMLPFVLAFSFYFFFRAVRTKKWWDFAIAGFVFGIGTHTYISFRIAPLILIVMLISFIITRERFLKEYWKNILVYALFVILAAAPMLYTFYVHPEYVSSRSSSISILSPEVNQGHLVKTFFKTFGMSLIAYNFWGDQNWRHNYPPYPILDPITGIAFLFGFAYSIIKLFHLLILRFRKKVRTPQLDVWVFLVSWFLIMLIPEFMTAEGLPHALRAIGTQPVALIFAALTFNYFIVSSKQHGYLFRKLVMAILILILLVIGFFNVIKYHYFWANQTETARSFELSLMDIVREIKSLPAQEEKIIVTGSMQRIPIQVFTYPTDKITYLYPGEIDRLDPKDPDDFQIFMTEKDDGIISRILEKYPSLQLEERTNRFGISHYLMK